jgi:hypothetical protein
VFSKYAVQYFLINFRMVLVYSITTVITLVLTFLMLSISIVNDYYYYYYYYYSCLVPI